jgi:hypothetical protein
MMQTGPRKDAQGQPWLDYLHPGQAGDVRPWVMALYPDGTTLPTNSNHQDGVMHEVAS